MMFRFSTFSGEWDNCVWDNADFGILILQCTIVDAVCGQKAICIGNGQKLK